MEKSLSIHQALRERDKSRNWPYTSSIMVVNRGVPLLEESFGQLDYSWLLKVTAKFRCKETGPMVVRHVSGDNLSLTPEYRKRDFYLGLLEIDGDVKTMKRWYSSRARYHYVMGETRLARFFFLRGHISVKTILYIASLWSPVLRRLIIKRFKVWG